MIGRDFVWVLCLNDMRSNHIEDLRYVARADSRAALVAFIDAETVEPYEDPSGLPAVSPNYDPHGGDVQVNPPIFYKSFRRGGPLEWYNRPSQPFVDETSPTENFRLVPRIIDRSQEIDAILAV